MIKTLFCCLFLVFFCSAMSQERIYIHYDRTQYAAGDTIWFKAYLYQNGKPSFTSRNFYLQLVDLYGRKCTENKYIVIGAAVNGGIVLPDSLKQPFYVLRAFTPESIRYDEAFIYKKILPINHQKVSTKTGSNLLVNFAADGNTWPLGVNTNLFVYSRTAAGTPVSVKGFIKDKNDSIVKSFSTEKDGIGMFNLKANHTEPYRAIILWNNDSFTYELPPVTASGIGLTVQAEGNSFDYRIAVGNHLTVDDTLSLSVKQNQHLVLYREHLLKKDVAIQGRVNITNAEAGLFEFILENKSGQLLASRTVFAVPDKTKTLVDIQPVHIDFSAHALNKINIQFPDTIPRSYSVSVVADDTLNTDKQREWIDYRLLLPGYLQQDPASVQHNYAGYFTDSAGFHQLNRLLAFYRPGSFNSPLADINDPYLVSAEGTVFNAANTARVSGGKLNMLMMNDGKQLLIETPVSAEGRFKADSLIFFGDAKLFYTYYNDRGRMLNVKIRVDSTQRDPRFDRIPYYKDIFAAVMDTANLNSPVFSPATGTTLKEVTVFTKIKKTTVADRYVSERFKNDGVVLFDMSKSVNRSTLFDLIRVKLPSLYIRKEDDGTLRLLTKTFYGLNTGQWEADVYLNEFKSKLDDVINILIEDIALIKYNTVGFPIGALMIYLKRPEDRMLNIPTNNNFFTIKGYAPFLTYEPIDYTSIDQTKPIKDTRKTLLWKPGIYANNISGNQELEFYNNDNASSFLITIEGMDLKGRLFRKQIRLKK